MPITTPKPIKTSDDDSILISLVVYSASLNFRLALFDLSRVHLKYFTENAKSHLGSLFGTNDKLHKHLLHEFLVGLLFILLSFTLRHALDVSFILVTTKFYHKYISAISFLRASA